MTDSTVFRWLHISDIHIGRKGNEWINSTLRTRLSTFLEARAKFDFIVITGDIINQGNFQIVDNKEAVQRLFSILSEHTDHLLLCAGNHDYNRSDSRSLLLQKWQMLSDDSKEESECEFESKLQGDFQMFSKFCKEMNIKNTEKLAFTNVYSSVEGINIVMMNTSVFSGQPQLSKDGSIKMKDGKICVDDTGKIRLTRNSLPGVEELDGRCPTVVFGHHPLEMMDTVSKKRLIEFMDNVPTTFYFCGHVHKNTICEESHEIQQYTSAGMFVDNYNHPTIAIHSMPKAKNTTLDSEYYSFENGNWRKMEQPVSHEGKSSDSGNKNQYSPCEPVSNLDMGKDSFLVEQSDYSDGAICLPYDNGVFNIYNSIARQDDILIPHIHNDIDEVTYVIGGKVYTCLDREIRPLSEGEAIIIPKNTFHSFIPAEYPCKYITMSTVIGKENQNFDSAKWIKDIRNIEEIERTLDQERERSRLGNHDDEEASNGYLIWYDRLITYLSSPILEVRWRAIVTLKKYIAEESEDGEYITANIKVAVTSKLKSSKTEDRFYGLSLAYEFRTDLTPKRISFLLSIKNDYMLAWACAYNVIIKRVQVDFVKQYNRVLNSEKHSLSAKYHELCILAILELLIKHDGKLMRCARDLPHKIEMPEQYIPFEDILSYFVLWYMSFTFQGTFLNFSKASQRIDKLNSVLGKDFLRKMQTLSDSQERADIIKKCKDSGVLFNMMEAYFESIEDQREDANLQIANIKKQIKTYLRIIVSERCNLKCVYCHHEGRIDSLIGKEISNNSSFNLDSVLEKAVKCGISKVKISGGEPLLFPNVLQICKNYQDAFDDIGFTSNGTRIIPLQSELEKIKGSKISFNISLNSLIPKRYEEITGKDELSNVKKGIEYLVDNGFKVKINSVITSKNVDEMEQLISYAARLGIEIKLLDLFNIGAEMEDFQHVSVAEIKSQIMQLYRKNESDFIQVNDYFSVNVLGTKVLIPRRVYSANCQMNCKKYPCAEGLFGIRLYEDYSCAYCFDGEVYKGGIEQIESNISLIRARIDSVRISY